jgi:hypothetical protein
MPEQLYRLSDPQGFPDMELIPARDFFRAHFADEVCNTPPVPLVPYTWWQCWNEDCAVGEVRVRASYPDGDPPQKPAMHCPGCGRPLEFRGYLRTLTLLPADGPGGDRAD